MHEEVQPRRALGGAIFGGMKNLSNLAKLAIACLLCIGLAAAAAWLFQTFN